MLIVQGRRGFTLAEIILTLVITLAVAGALHTLLFTTQRLTWIQALQVSLQSSVRAGTLVVLNELRDLATQAGGSAAQNDILRIAPTAMTYRAMRGIGFICQTPAATGIRIARAGFSGHRDPQAGRDTAYVFIEGDPEADADDSWLPLAITSVSTAGACPGALGPGITLGIPITASVTGLEIGTPVRFSEIMELRLYQSDGRSWLGARSVSAGEAIQPVVGPLGDGDGFGLEYLDASGEPTTDPATIKSIRVTLRGTESTGSARIGNLEEELISQVTLRNAWRQ